MDSRSVGEKSPSGPINTHKDLKFFGGSADALVSYKHQNCTKTFVLEIKAPYRLKDKSIVKLVFNKKGEVNDMTREDNFCKFDKKNLYKQVDIISFKPDKLQKFSALRQTKNEIKRKIELMRALDNKFKIKTVVVKTDSFSVNTKSDYEKAKKKY